MAESEKVLAELLSELDIKKDKDVEEIYLANKGLSEICNLQRYRHLKHLWLNGNKLRRINCLSRNLHLSELYLQNNQLVDISGALNHLTCLRVLLLQNNQLTNLESIVAELQRMQCLTTLNLYNNPVAQEAEYRLYVLRFVPSLNLLDRKEILKPERDHARKIYDQEQEEIRETVAFGRRSQGPPALFFPSTPVKSIVIPTDNKEVANHYLKDCQIYDDIQEAVNIRRLGNTVKLYTAFNWSKVPRIEERRTAEFPFDTPEMITHIYR